MKLRLWIIVGVLLFFHRVQLDAATLPVKLWDQWIQSVATQTEPNSSPHLAELSNIVQHAIAVPAERTALEKSIVRALQSRQATIDGKQALAPFLGLIGSATAMPVLAALLTQPEHYEVARTALSSLKDPAAFRVLLAGLEQNHNQASEPLHSQAAEALIVCADQLAAKGETKAAEHIFEQLFNPSEKQAVRVASLRGLVKLQGDKGLELLLPVLASPTDPLQPVAVELLRSIATPATVARIAADLAKFPASSQIAVIPLVAEHGGPSALSAIEPLIHSRNEKVQLAAIQAAPALNSDSILPSLIDLMANERLEVRTAVRNSLIRLRGNTVDDRIMTSVGLAPAPLQADLIQCLVARGTTRAVPLILALATNAEPAVQFSAITALGTLSNAADLPAVVGLLLQLSDDAALSAVETSLKNLTARTGDPAELRRILSQRRDQASEKVQPVIDRLLISLTPDPSDHPDSWK